MPSILEALACFASKAFTSNFSVASRLKKHIKHVFTVKIVPSQTLLDIR